MACANDTFHVACGDPSNPSLASRYHHGPPFPPRVHCCSDSHQRPPQPRHLWQPWPGGREYPQWLPVPPNPFNIIASFLVFSSLVAGDSSPYFCALLSYSVAWSLYGESNLPYSSTPTSKTLRRGREVLQRVHYLPTVPGLLHCW